MSGTRTHFAPGATKVSVSGGIIAANEVINGRTEMAFSVSVPSSAAAGSYTVTITTGSESVTGSFEVTTPVAALIVVNPNSAAPGTSKLTVHLQGVSTKWVSGKTRASFGSGVSVGGAPTGQSGPITVMSATAATATISVASGATLGAQTVTVTTGSEIETAPGSLTVANCSSVPTTSTFTDDIYGSPLNASLRLTFSTPLSRASVAGAVFLLDTFSNNTYTSLHASLDVTGKVLTLTPEPLLPAGTSASVQGSLVDTCGNTAYVSSGPITTGIAIETGPLQAVKTSIRNGEVKVPTSPVIAFRFNQAVASTTVAANVTLASAAGPVALTLGQNSDPNRVSFTPTTPLALNTTYTVVYGPGITDQAGHALTNPGSFAFTTISQNSTQFEADTLFPISSGLADFPTVAGTDVQPKVLAHVGFDLTTVDANSLLLTDERTGSRVTGIVTLSNDLRTLTLKPGAPLQPNHPYAAVSSKVSTLDGNLYFPQGDTATFITGVGPSAALQLTSISPPNGSVKVPLDTDIDAQFSSRIDYAGVAPTSFVVTAANGTVVAGETIGAFAGDNSIRWAPFNQLEPNTTYTVSISGVPDYLGNPAATSKTSFTTGSEIAGELHLVGISPASGATNVSPNAPIKLTFNLPVDSGSLAGAGVSAGSVAIAGTWSVKGSVATFSPSTPYPSDTEIAIAGYVAGYSSFTSATINSAFVTQYYAAVPSFRVTSTSPTNNSSGILPNTPIYLQFSEPVLNYNLNSIVLLSGDTSVAYSAFVSTDARTITLAPGALAFNSTVTVRLDSQIADIYGTPLQSYTFQYKTSSAGAQNFSVAGTRPSNGATEVPPSASIYLFLNRTGLDQASVQSGLAVTVNNTVIQTQISFPDPQTIKFVPVGPLPPGAKIAVGGTGQDTLGNPLIFFPISFTTADPSNTAPPEPVRSSFAWPKGGQNAYFEVQYDQALLASSVSAQAVQLSYTNGSFFYPVPVKVSLNAATNVLIVNPQQAINGGLTYSLAVNSGPITVKGANGLSAAPFSQSFGIPSTPAASAARVIGTVPDTDAIGVGTNAAMSLLFDHPIDFLSVSSTSLSLTTGNTTVPLNFVLDASGTMLTATPQQPLTPHSVYTLRYSGLADFSGNAIAAGSFSFTTASGVDLVAPQVIAASFNNGTVPTNAPISFVFDKPMVLSTLEASLFGVGRGSWTESADRKTATFTPSTPWTADSQIFLGFGNAQDETGLILQGGGFLSFYIGSSSSEPAPQIIRSSPQAGATGLPRNVAIQVEFAAPISSDFLGGVTLATAAGPVQAGVSVLPGTNILSIAPNDLLAANTTYVLTVSGITNTGGMPLSQPYTLQFTTGPGVLGLPAAPTLNPVGQVQNFSDHSPITVLYSQSLNPLWPIAYSIEVLNMATNTPVKGTITLCPLHLLLSFVPSDSWAPGTTYSVSVPWTYFDIVGNLLPPEFWTFTTPAVLGPGTESVTSVSPANNESNVSLNAAVQIVLASAVDPVTVNANTFWVTDAKGYRVPGIVSIPTSQLVTFTVEPATTWLPRATYTVHVSGLTNQSGVALTPFTSKFQTSPE